MSGLSDVERMLVALAVLAGMLAVDELAAAPAAVRLEEPPCGQHDIVCPMAGEADPISFDATSTAWVTQQVTWPSAPAFGSLVYDPDYTRLEQHARGLLKDGLRVREALSPYKGSVPFETYVKRLDYEAGFDPDWQVDYTHALSETFTSYCGIDGSGSPALQDVVDCADAHFRAARDMYAFLVVHAPGHRFRVDARYVSEIPPGHGEPLCGSTDKEDPDPRDDTHSGFVMDPVVDWCNFRARLRQSVREGANLRMIFGQQFMVDALGVHFSGIDLLGGENAVRAEMAQLRAARHQFEFAEAALTESLERAVGSGCYVSDFYTQSEWSLLSRAIGLRETAQHHIAVRRSYLDIGSPEEVPEVRGEAMGVYRDALMNGYIKLIGLASIGASQPLGVGCSVGERPDGLLVAEMALNMAETRRDAQEMSAGRNIFGFETSKTPAWPYGDSGDYKGLKTIAEEAYLAAVTLEETEKAGTREYDDAQEDLIDEVTRIEEEVDQRIVDVSGCGDKDPEDEWFACALAQKQKVKACLNLVSSCIPPNPAPDPNPCPVDHFAACVNAAGANALKNGSAKAALIELRGLYASYRGINQRVRDMTDRIKAAQDSNAEIKHWLQKSGDWEQAARIGAAVFEYTNCIDFDEWGIATGLSLAACSVASGINAGLQGHAGAISTDANVTIQDEEAHKELKNLLLDQGELAIDAYAALQQYDSKRTELLNQLDGLHADVLEARRQRAHFLKLPANDPSYRIVRDSNRMQWARAMTTAGELAYLAARRWEFENAKRLAASNVRISDIYRARIASDVGVFLGQLGLLQATQPTVDESDHIVSFAEHVLHWTDGVLESEGIPEEDYEAVRTERFRQWVKDNTRTGTNNKPVLDATFTTTLAPGGLWNRMIAENFDETWLLKLNNRVSVNLVTEEDTELDYRSVTLTQRGTVHLKSLSGCIFDYCLIAPAVMLGLEWDEEQEPDVAFAAFKANVNGLHDYGEPGYRTNAFVGRPASAVEFQLIVKSGYPVDGMPDMDLQQLIDIQLLLGTDYASRQPGTPEMSQCVRIDW